MQTILIILGIFLLYKFIADFVIPIYRTTKRVQQQFRDMQQQHNSTQNNYNPSAGDQSSYNSSTSSKANSKDYIEFEEIKD